jgi:SAM-dependent methyltransferase
MPHWFEPLADHAGAAYLRYSFTKGTEQEVGFLVDELKLQPGHRLLDVGCGPGRHSHGLAERAIEVVGVDISGRFVELAHETAPARARFVRGDARALPVATGSCDAAISLCQGGFGLVAGEDGAVIAEMARALKSGGRLAASAFSSYFAVRFLEETDTFDAGAGVNHERATVKNEAGEDAEFDLWTSCFTPRELRLIADRAGLAVDAIWSVTPGAYARNRPDLEHPEWLLLAHKPSADLPGQPE